MIPSSAPLAPAFQHDVKVTPTGLRNKLEVFEEYLGTLSPEQATMHLKHVVASALGRNKYRQFYYEEVQVCLRRGANPLDRSQDISTLACVLCNANLNESIAAQSARLLCNAIKQAGQEMGSEERGLLQEKLEGPARFNKFKQYWEASKMPV